MNIPTANPEHLPQLLADELDGLIRTHEHDTEVCRALRIAREQLRAISWARFKQRHERSDKLAVLCRRHKGHRMVAR